MTTVSNGQRVIELICEIGRLGGAIEVAMTELRTLTDNDPVKVVQSSAIQSPDEKPSWFEPVLSHMKANPNQACKASDICKSVGCSSHALTYCMRVLIGKGLVKRVKKGYYQCRGGTAEL